MGCGCEYLTFSLVEPYGAVAAGPASVVAAAQGPDKWHGKWTEKIQPCGRGQQAALRGDAVEAAGTVESNGGWTSLVGHTTPPQQTVRLHCGGIVASVQCGGSGGDGAMGV
jgi:hypothetical protein